MVKWAVSIADETPDFGGGAGDFMSDIFDDVIDHLLGCHFILVEVECDDDASAAVHAPEE